MSPTARSFIGSAILLALGACSGGGSGGDDTSLGGATTNVDGLVVGVSDATVCLDANRSGRCEDGEAQARSGATGSFTLAIAAGAGGSYVAEVVAGRSRDADGPVTATYRMASATTTISPFTTLRHLTRESDPQLADDLARNEVGLPPKFDLDAAPAPGSFAAGASRGIVAALKATNATLDFYSNASVAQLVAAFPAALTTLPSFAINTRDAAPIDSKEVYRDATFALTNPAVSDAPVALNGKVRGRGNETWLLPKKPYKVQLANDAAYAALSDVLGMKKSRNWALLADYLDRSLVRNKVTYSLGSSAVFRDGLKWTPSCQHVEVTVNGEYEGVYLFCEDIRLAPERLDLHKMATDPAAGDATGGLIFEVDNKLDCYAGDPINLQHITPRGAAICIDTPDETAITVAQQAYAKNLLNEVEADIFGPMRLDRINPVSFADWYLVEELVRNPDSTFFSSDWLWKDSDSAADPKDRLLNMGPLWDFDHSIGNSNEFNLWSPEGCWVTKGRDYDRNWYRKIFDNADFARLVTDRWKAKRPALQKFVDAGIDAYARRLREAERRNFARWPILGLPLASHDYFATWEEEVAFAKSYLDQRIAWMDRAFATPEAFNAMCR